MEKNPELLGRASQADNSRGSESNIARSISDMPNIEDGSKILRQNSEDGRCLIKRRSSLLNVLSREPMSKAEFCRPVFENVNNRLNELMTKYLSNDVDAILTSIGHHLEYTLAINRFRIEKSSCYQAAALSTRDRILEIWNDTQMYITDKNPKRAYYLSIEYLLGRFFKNALRNTELEGTMKEALNQIGMGIEEIYDQEADAGLGNGGLGRLAACYLDSLSTLNYPAWGYGVRYSFGIFQQKIIGGNQVEIPDYWLAKKNVWEIERNDIKYRIMFYGKVRRAFEKGREKVYWENGETVRAMAYDNPVPGFDTNNTINLRLWKSIPDEELNFKKFDQGDYYGSLNSKQVAEIITSVLYPNDNTPAGKELRLKQEYFFVCASIQDILRRFRKKQNPITDLPKKVAIQLNDTHPALAIVELMRILVDEEELEVQAAWKLVTQIFNYTNHTVLPEALEKWSVPLFQNLLPRHMELIYLINYFWLEKISAMFPGDSGKMRELSIIEESEPKMIRMANLCIVASQKVNGVAKIHSDILKSSLFKSFADLEPSKFINITNGVTPRRWVYSANPNLAEFFTEMNGSDEWVRNFPLLEQLKERATDREFQKTFEAIKVGNKKRLCDYLYKNYKIKLNPNSLFDVMVKRIHEYKRQFMFCLYILFRYFRLKRMTFEQREESVKRTFIMAGKSAPGYYIAKRVIKFANSIADLVNLDLETNKYMQFVFVPNYCVTLAETLIPASDLSEHISTAGTEASGTSNMKFVFNGGLIIGTSDGANIEIAREIGDENIFIFGAKVDQVAAKRQENRTKGYEEYMPVEIKEIFAEVRKGLLGDPNEFHALLNSISNNNDHYLVGADFKEYIAAQDLVDETFKRREKWLEMAIRATLSMGFFSSDRSIGEYAAKIWEIEPVNIPNNKKERENE